jgi:uncharacterized membrane protein
MNWRKVTLPAGAFTKRAIATQVGTAEAAGLLHASASLGPSFERSLLPRTTIQQAAVTGVISAINYGITTTVQSAVEAFANRVAGGLSNGSRSKRATILAADLAILGGSVLTMKFLSQRPEESLWRAGARTAAFRLATAAGTGAIAVSADGAVDVVTRNDTPGSVNAPFVLVVGSAIGTGIHLSRSRRLLDTAADADQYGSEIRPASLWEPIQGITVGTGVSVGLYMMSVVESKIAEGTGRIISWAVPGLAPASKAIGHAAVLATFGLAIERSLAFAYSKTETAGNAIEPAYRARPVSEYVSGGPKSKIDWDSIGREGRRFVNMALTAEEIETVTRESAIDPIRVFVGYESAVSPNARAYQAMEELEAMGAFERDFIAVFSPTGSGYVNYVAAETTEFITGGNVASVCIQYSVRPSFLSLDRVGTAWESNLALLTALAWKIRSMPKAQQPKILLFGESLGSQSAQDVFEKEGVQGFDILDIHRALFVGSPYSSKWRRRWLADPLEVDPDGKVVEVASRSEWEALDGEQRADLRVVLLTHHLDPIPKFGAALLVQAPSWLGDPDNRPADIPRDSRYWPLFTFLLTGVDLLNADHVVPGQFEAYGHDYRADLPQMTRIAFGLEADAEKMDRIEKALRKRELGWAQRRLVADTFETAEKTLRDKLDDWGVDHTIVPGIVTAQRDVEPDPYEAKTVGGGGGGGPRGPPPSRKKNGGGGG